MARQPRATDVTKPTEAGPLKHDVIGLFTSDWHLSLKKPLARGEENWLEYEGTVLKQLRDLQVKYSVPMFVVGDLFDRWDVTAELINWTLWNLPNRLYAIPGNHDMPYHSYKEMPRSAYWTLVEAGKLTNLTPGGPGPTAGFGPICGASYEIYSYPPGFEVRPVKASNSLSMQVALIHDYIWTAKTGYTTAPDSKRYAKWMPLLEGYDVAIFGDNHQNWLIQSEDKVSILNCGTLMRRKATEMNLKPSVGLLHANGQITRHFLDVSQDEWSDMGMKISKIEESLKVDLDGFIGKLNAAKTAGWDWKGMVTSYCRDHKIDGLVKDYMMASLEETK